MERRQRNSWFFYDIKGHNIAKYGGNGNSGEKHSLSIYTGIYQCIPDGRCGIYPVKADAVSLKE